MPFTFLLFFFLFSVFFFVVLLLSIAVQRVRVRFDYEATQDDEFSLSRGEIVYVTSKRFSDGWWEGRFDEKLGFFPSNYVEILPE